MRKLVVLLAALLAAAVVAAPVLGQQTEADSSGDVIEAKAGDTVARSGGDLGIDALGEILGGTPNWVLQPRSARFPFDRLPFEGPCALDDEGNLVVTVTNLGVGPAPQVLLFIHILPEGNPNIGVADFSTIIPPLRVGESTTEVVEAERLRPVTLGLGFNYNVDVNPHLEVVELSSSDNLLRGRCPPEFQPLPPTP